MVVDVNSRHDANCAVSDDFYDQTIDVVAKELLQFELFTGSFGLQGGRNLLVIIDSARVISIESDQRLASHDEMVDLLFYQCHFVSCQHS